MSNMSSASSQGSTARIEQMRGAATGGSTSRKPMTTKPLNIVSTMFRDCLCDTYYAVPEEKKTLMLPNKQFVELTGIRYIGLGAVVDELTPRERVYDTLEVLRTRTDRMISVGYLMDEEEVEVQDETATRTLKRKTVEMMPLDVFEKEFPSDGNLSKDAQRIIDLLREKNYTKLITEVRTQYEWQKSQPGMGTNRYLAGISAHNLAVANILAGRDDITTPIFREAIAMKEKAFGAEHGEVALSWDGLGIQLFANGNFDEAMDSFRRAQKIRESFRVQALRSETFEQQYNPSIAMTLNNIACCEFQLGKHTHALETLEKTRRIQVKAIGSSAKADLDLLHVAIVYCNCGYLNLALKKYEEAESILQEGLLIFQSVLDDNHRAVRDTLSNIEFANAFHS